MENKLRPVGSKTIHYGPLTQAEAFETLENIREMGVVNMLGAAPVLQQAQQALVDWIEAYRNR